MNGGPPCPPGRPLPASRVRRGRRSLPAEHELVQEAARLHGARLCVVLDRLFKVRLAHLGPLAAHHADGSLVCERRELRAAHARAEAGHGPQVHVGRKGQLLCVHRQDVRAALRVGDLDLDDAVEAPGPREGRVEEVGPVGGPGDDDAVVCGLKAVHAGQELVEGLLHLVVGPGEPQRSPLADGVELVDEDDAGRHLRRLEEERAEPRGAPPHKYLHKV
mmetsp:Transcript_16329/g.54933  ORF Transcript_16329/g.54933 Transcript_16329/m.54933 type:complete len:219 (-) Transcript_16329:858-1514(-)